jgi:hypothetical protein
MMKPRHTTLCASAAIAAALTLTPAAGLAQAAPAPVLTVPEITAPPAAPPAAQAPVMTSSPVVQPLPEPEPVVEEAAPPPAARTTTTTVRQATPQRPAAAPAAPAPQPETVAEPVETVTASEPEPIAAVPIAAPEHAAPPATSNSNDSLLPAVLGALAVLALAIWGFVAIGRRKPVDRRAATLERPLPKPAAATVLAEPVVAQPVMAEPVVTEPVLDRVTPIGPPRTAPEASLAHTGAAVPLPRKMPESFAERDALLNRMVAARPDRANPFTSPLQRRRRAKLILQSLGTDFSDREPWIDLSQYPQNWPELARNKHAAA